MGKRVKKKGRSPHKEKRVVNPSPQIASQQSNATVETADNAVPVAKGGNQCTHLDKGVDLSKITVKIGSSQPVKCEDCRESATDRRVKGKHGKKKGSGLVDSKSEYRATWMCLECGRFGCGGVGFPTTTQSHAVWHARQARHPVAIQFENPQLRWCFPCNSLIPVERPKENGEHKDVMLDVARMIKGKSAAVASVDVEDVWFGSGSMTRETKSENTLSGGFDERGGYVVRGLVNLGNTCFFNSIMQNLLAMNRLRGYFLKIDGSFGPITIALKKLFIETISEGGLRNVINPRSLFGSLCSKAPQFRGYQQHDSHELLRCLLDWLCTEELSTKKQVPSSQEDGISPNEGTTFVDAVFGGQVSSTVSCLECGHSSVVYEPFLDLSLPVPTKKPPSKKAKPVSRAKKTKLPPKRAGKVRSKLNKEADGIPSQTLPSLSASKVPSSQMQSSVTVIEKPIASSGNPTLLYNDGPVTVADNNGLVSQTVSTTQMLETVQVSENVTEKAAVPFDDSTWLDYLEAEALSDSHDVAPQNDDVLVVPDSGKDSVHNDILLQSNLESTSQVALYREPNIKLEASESNWDDTPPILVQDSQVLLLPYKEETSTVLEIMGGEGEASLSVISCEQDSSEFDGFGDLFNEPEVAEGTSSKTLSGASYSHAEVVDTGFMAGNSSESDPDEVDNTDSPVSVESCLAYFTKPELLSDEHAWHCENCSKIVREQKMKSQKNKLQIKSMSPLNGGKDRIDDDLMGLGQDFLGHAGVVIVDNGNIKNDIVPDSLVSHNVNMKNSILSSAELKTIQTGELNPGVPVASQRDEGNGKDMLSDSSHSSSCYRTCSQASFGDQSTEIRSVNESSGCFECSTDEANPRNSQLSIEACESGENEDGEMDSERVKVKRDATKRFLISKVPPILTIHLKRFSQDARGRLSKLNGHVDFRNTIDLRQYMDPRCIEKDEYTVRLIGVVEHSGTMKNGHYVAYVRGGETNRGLTKEENGDVWYYISDVLVRKVSLEEVLHCEAYILFYEKN